MSAASQTISLSTFADERRQPNDGQIATRRRTPLAKRCARRCPTPNASGPTPSPASQTSECDQPKAQPRQPNAEYQQLNAKPRQPDTRVPPARRPVPSAQCPVPPARCQVPRVQRGVPPARRPDPPAKHPSVTNPRPSSTSPVSSATSQTRSTSTPTPRSHGSNAECHQPNARRRQPVAKRRRPALRRPGPRVRQPQPGHALANARRPAPVPVQRSIANLRRNMSPMLSTEGSGQHALAAVLQTSPILRSPSQAQPKAGAPANQRVPYPLQSLFPGRQRPRITVNAHQRPDRDGSQSATKVIQRNRPIPS